ncbi:MAG: hypothetical protein RSE25_10355 [Bacteroidales bacterium]
MKTIKTNFGGKFSVCDLYYCNGVVTSMVRGCLCGLTLYDALDSLERVTGKEIFNLEVGY